MTGNAEHNKYLDLNNTQVEDLYKYVQMCKDKYPNFDINFNYGEDKIYDLDGGCSWGRTSVAIMLNGNIIPCVYNDVMYLGNAIN